MVNSIGLGLLLRALAIVFLGGSVKGAEYWVSKGGDDATGIGSRLSPWSTIGRANLVAASPGDIVHVLGPGLWEESVQPSHGGSFGTPITWKWENGAQSRCILLNRVNYVRIIGAEVTNAYSSFLNSGIQVQSANYCEILDCYVHDVYGGGIKVTFSAPVVGLIVRSNKITRTGVYSGTQNDSAAGVYIWGTNNLCEYNDISRVSDFFSAGGTGNIFRNNYLHDVADGYYATSAPHVDLIEESPSNGDLNDVVNVFERNFALSNSVANGHGLLCRNVSTDGTTNYGTLYRLNAIQNLGSYAVVDECPYLHYYNNTVGRADSAKAQEAALSISYVSGSSNMHCVSMNNILYHCNDSMRIYYAGYAPPDFKPDYDCVYGGAVPGIVEAHAKLQDPLLVNYSAGDLHVQSNSPAIGNGGVLTTAVGSGSSSTNLTVTDPYFFCDGHGIADADWITIAGGAKVQIKSVDYARRVIALTASRSWSSGAAVRLYGTQDIGAYPYLSAGFGYGIAIGSPGQGSTNSGPTTITAYVTNAPVVRIVRFYVDGLELTNTSPAATITVSANLDTSPHTIEARAYALYADPKLAASATVLVNPTQPPAAPQGLRIGP